VDTATPARTAPLEIDTRPLRLAGAGMLTVAALTPPIPIASVPYRCPLRTLTGIPCPFCGMTRGVIEAVHVHLSASFLFNPGAMLLVALAVALLVAWRVERIRIPVWTPFVFFGLLWSFELWKYATDRPL
jgi:hypothetical protein